MDIAAERAYPTPFASSPLFPLLLMSLATQRNAPIPATSFKNEYDYIVVGAGSAGAVVATRLSEEQCVDVLLLEAGKPAPHVTDVPSIARNFWFTDVDWQYKTVPQKHSGKALNNRQVIWPCGKALGGSSMLNLMMYIRGNRQNYDNWEASGATGWSFNDVWPYFLKLENNRDPEFIANGYHVVNGPLSAEKQGYQAEYDHPIYEAAAQMGYDINDCNAGRQTGFSILQSSIRNGQRCSTAKAYLVPAENRTNLDIVPYAHVRKVLFNGNQATGVQFEQGGTTHEVKARREIIMSAGSVNSAQLLMLSGIGPKEHLEKFNIPVIADLPVGNNLQNHYSGHLNFLLDQKYKTPTEKLKDPQNIQEYIDNRTGPLSSTQFITVTAFLKGLQVSPKEDFPTYQLIFDQLPEELQLPQSNMKLKVHDAYFGPYKNKTKYTCESLVIQPKSRGTVRLNSADPNDKPLIDPNYFESPDDVQAAVDGMKVCMKIGTSEPLKKVGSKPFESPFPGCEKYQGNQDKLFACVAKAAVATYHHPVGTCKMGDPSDPTTVVDTLLRVKKVTGLRVVDASIMPIIPSGNTNIPTIMVGEKASDIIKQTIQCPPQTDKIVTA